MRLVLNREISLKITLSFDHDRKMYYMVIFVVTEKGRISVLREPVLLIVLLLIHQGQRVAKKRDGSWILAQYCSFAIVI